MFRTLLILGVLSSCIISCKKENVQLSITEEKMVDLIVDVQTAEEMIARHRSYHQDSVRSLYIKQITDIHQLDSAVIFDNIKALNNNAELAFQVYSKVYDKLDKVYKTVIAE